MCCSDSKKPSTDFVMEGEFQNSKEGFFCNYSVLLELAAADDLIGFRRAVEEEGLDVDEISFWYGRGIGLKKMGFEGRTPLMIAAMFGSQEVLKYIVATGRVDVNRACGWSRTTALHCAAAGGSSFSPEIIKFLLDSSADVNSLDAHGNRPGDLIAPVFNPNCNPRKKLLEMMLNGCGDLGEERVFSDDTINQSEEHNQKTQSSLISKDGSEKKEYPIDLSLPDIKNGIYGTDEFRMYTFKVKPCSRAYSHDWTECPFVHPGENARRRDPRKYHYSCVPCPEFRKGSCRQGDACEYAHGVFECWLHPAQYRTRLCKDETGCTRRVCFFAHKREELRPLYASTGSGVPSPRSSSPSLSSLDMAAMSPLALGSPSVMMLPSSTPPMSPSVSSSSSSSMGNLLWQNQPSLIPPTLQLPSSRLKTAVNARDMDLEMELLGLEHHQKQQLINEISNLSSQSNWSNSMATAAALTASSGGRNGDYRWLGGVKPTNLEDVFGSLDPSMLSQLQELSLNPISSPQLHSPTGIQMRQNMNQQIRSSLSSNISSSPARTPSSFALDPSSAMATASAAMNSRSAAFAKRSQSFIDRGALNRVSGLSSSMNYPNMGSSTLSDWGSPDGKLDWGIQGEELHKLRKSASFGFRSSSNVTKGSASMGQAGDEPDVSWVQSLVKDAPPAGLVRGSDMESLPPWLEQLYMEQEQMVA